MDTKDIADRTYPKISTHQLMYGGIVFTTMAKLEEVQKAHFAACFHDSFSNMLQDERRQYNDDLFFLLEDYPEEMLAHIFPFIRSDDVTKTRTWLFRKYKLPEVQHPLI